MPFYNPIKLTIQETPVLVYPCGGVEALLSREEKGIIERYILKLYAENKNILASLGEYNIIILWNEGKDVMADIWIYDKLESWGSGPLVDVKIFRNFNIEKNIGVSAGDGLILLGKEEEHRRSKNSLAEYINGDRPELLEDMVLKEDFN
ncbi:hypothetical protein KAR26_01615 [Candidatus Parcubacteria bacterium]|nr:hypothetical protein [Candidatus Parcubacteria bacterium]